MATALAASIYAGFFSAVFSKKLYGGANYDTNGVLPVSVFGLELDLNISVFATIIALLVVAAGIEAVA